MNAQTKAAQNAKSAADQADTAPQETQRPDPFAGLPTVTLAEATVPDTSTLQCSNPRKYAKTHEAAVGARMPIQSGWKYASALFIPGASANTKEFRQGSVFGTIVDIVKRAGKAGIPSYELATELRRAQIGNKRSHYCEQVPPVGWAEGYINSAVQQGLVAQHATRKAPALVVAAAQDAGDKAQGKGDSARTGTEG